MYEKYYVLKFNTVYLSKVNIGPTMYYSSNRDDAIKFDSMDKLVVFISTINSPDIKYLVVYEIIIREEPA